MITLWLLVWLTIVIGTGKLAKHYRRAVAPWVILAMLFGPFALLCLWAIGRRVTVTRNGCPPLDRFFADEPPNRFSSDIVGLSIINRVDGRYSQE